MSEYAIKAINVCKAYGAREVLKNFSLALEVNKFEVLMGASGSGKSTFLHVAAGLISADEGSVIVAGEDVTKMTDSKSSLFRRRKVGVVFQAFNLLKEKSVKENILMPLILDGKAKSSVAKERLQVLSSRLGLDNLLDKKPDELSGGEQQRVAFARALIIKPSIILADEPTGNLDAKAAKEICELLKEIQSSENCAILVVTHDPLVAAVAEKVHFLKDGKISSVCCPNGNPSIVSKAYLES